MVFSSNKEIESTTQDNYFSYTVPVDFKNQLNLNGRSNPEQLDFSTKNKTNEEVFYDNEIGPVVSHLYEVLSIVLEIETFLTLGPESWPI